MYFFLNSTEAARTLNHSARPDSPVIVELTGSKRRDLLADLAARVTTAWHRPTRANAATPQQLAA